MRRSTVRVRQAAYFLFIFLLYSLTIYPMAMEQDKLEQMAKNLSVCSDKTIKEVMGSLSKEQGEMLMDLITKHRREKT